MRNPIADPMGHRIFQTVQGQIKTHHPRIAEVLRSPEFIIELKGERLYFFKLVAANQNLMVETVMVGGHYQVNGWMINPEVGFIAGLLEKGIFISVSGNTFDVQGHNGPPLRYS